jgi:hypothetical protein
MAIPSHPKTLRFHSHSKQAQHRVNLNAKFF